MSSLNSSESFSIGGRNNRRRPSERRVITVLFCDVANSTSMAEGFDPEEWAEVMNEAYEHLTGPITRYEGTIASLTGDGLLAFFGAPISHEDDPSRAILAGLGILEGVKPFAAQLKREYGVDFNVRVGINTGLVVVGEIGSNAVAEYTAMGDTVNVAARMEQTAEPGTVQITSTTANQIVNEFELEQIGGVNVKGKSDPVLSFRVTGSKSEVRQDRRPTEVSAPLIGRNQEQDRLFAAVDVALSGRGQIVSIIGEAGLGKSRLLDELYNKWHSLGVRSKWDYAVGIPYDSSRPYSLYHSMAKKTFGIGLEDSPEEIHSKVRDFIAQGGGSPEAVDLCSTAMERVIAAKVLHETRDYSADVIKKDLYEVVFPALMEATKTAPLAVVFDDMQWSDEASAELTMHLLHTVEESSALFVFAFRPERQSPAWKVKQYVETNFPHRYTEIVLGPLDERGTADMLSSVLQVNDLPSEVRSLIMRKTTGNPYFLEEVVRTLTEQGALTVGPIGLHWNADASIRDISIPDSLQALLMARMDRLSTDAKATLQLASVMGRSFYHKVLGQISESAMVLDKQLSDLERVELIREQMRQPELEYVFKHELARDAAYSTILLRRRRTLHRQVGEAMEVIFAGKLEENAHRLAYHFNEGLEHERALKYYLMAAESADGVDAVSESASLYSRALELARQSSEGGREVERIQSKLSELGAAVN
jgi:class 3 adenylate cyclase